MNRQRISARKPLFCSNDLFVHLMNEINLQRGGEIHLIIVLRFLLYMSCSLVAPLFLIHNNLCCQWFGVSQNCTKYNCLCFRWTIYHQTVYQVSNQTNSYRLGCSRYNISHKLFETGNFHTPTPVCGVVLTGSDFNVTKMLPKCYLSYEYPHRTTRTKLHCIKKTSRTRI